MFALLGVGFYLERAVGKKSQEMFGKKVGSSAYAGLLGVNIAIGFMIPQIDNAAHLGGLVAGIMVAFAWLRSVPNRIFPISRLKARLSLVLLGVWLTVGSVLSGSPEFLTLRLKSASEGVKSPQAQFELLSRILQLSPGDHDVRLQRLELSLKYGNYSTAKADFFLLLGAPQSDAKLKRLEEKLSAMGDARAVTLLRQLWGEVGPKL